MKKILLMAALFGGVYGSANAMGSCRVGHATLTPDGSGNYLVSCPGNGTCYETDESGLVTPGHHILIHLDGQLVDAVVVKSDSRGETPPNTPPNVPTDKLPDNIVVNIAQATN